MRQCLSSLMPFGEPELSAGTFARYATGVLILMLVYSWWGERHKRLWLACVWGAAVVLGALAVFGLWRCAAVPGLLAAALGGAFGAV